MWSTPLWLAASISTTSMSLPRRICLQDSHWLQGSPSAGAEQLSALARMRAVEVLPTPRGPEKSSACATCPRAMAWRSVTVMCFWPTTSEKFCGRARSAVTLKGFF